MTWPPHFCVTLLLALVMALGCVPGSTLGFQIGPRPTAPLGLIIKLKPDAVFASASGTADFKPVDRKLGLYRVDITDGQHPAAKAAEIEQQAGVEYVAVDEWLHLSAGLTLQAAPSPPPPRPRPRPPPPRPKLSPPSPQLPRPKLSPPSPRPRPQPPRPKLSPPSPRPRPQPPRPKLSSPSPRPRPPLRPPPRHPPRLPPQPRPKPRPPPPRRPQPPPARVPKTPNDPQFKQLWGMTRINATRAWAYKTDSSSVIVCTVDTGVKYNHPDLVPNLVPMDTNWKNLNTDDNGHGTHVAGIIGAVGNNRLGVAGVSWKASILACKALDSFGWGLTSKVVECIRWCRSRGAKVINTSFELETESQALKDAIGTATSAGVFFAAAAGNGNLNNNDHSPRYPASFNFPGNVAVANINAENDIDATSNFGPTTVHVAAPGTMILSTWIYREWNSGTEFYAQRTGTSMSAPCVAGAAALAIAASGGTLSNSQVAKLLILTSTYLPSLDGFVVANGVINLERLMVKAIQFGKNARAAAAAAAAAG